MNNIQFGLNNLRIGLNGFRSWSNWGIALCCFLLCACHAVNTPGRAPTPMPITFAPERIVLLPTAAPATSQTITWRTGLASIPTIVELVEASASPAFVRNTRQVVGQSQPLLTEAGLAQHHRVTLDGLSPNTLYSYRVKGEYEWSEWLQFRTAYSHFLPYTALYLGDTQNYIQSLGSRTVRAAFSAAPDAKVMIHAGDLIDRSGPYDQLWGEWFNAGSWILSSVNQLVVTGNHEYREAAGVAPQLLEHWPAHFALPTNGPENLQASVYTVDYQGVRYIVLDSMAAMHSKTAAQQQAQWLEGLLVNNPNQWTLVSYHHPLMSGSSGKVNPVIARYWQPLFERYRVDLVLQGHDHLYARWHNAQEPPVYTISVTGAKLNRVNPVARAQMQRVGEDAQWYQVIRFEAERLHYQAWTVTGELYDEFDLVRGSDGKKRVEAVSAILPPERFCSKPTDEADESTIAPGAYLRPARCWLVPELE